MMLMRMLGVNLEFGPHGHDDGLPVVEVTTPTLR